MYAELNNALDLLILATGDGSAEILGKRYGEDAGKLSRDCMHTIGNVKSVVELRPTSVAKSVGKEALKHAGQQAGRPEAPQPEARELANGPAESPGEPPAAEIAAEPAGDPALVPSFEAS